MSRLGNGYGYGYARPKSGIWMRMGGRRYTFQETGSYKYFKLARPFGNKRQDKQKPRENTEASRGFEFYRNYGLEFARTLLDHHVGVKGVLRQLLPEIGILGVGQLRVVDLLESRVFSCDFLINFLSCNVAGI